MFFSEELVETEMVSQVAAPEVFHDHVEVFPVLEGTYHVDDEGVVQLLEDSFLVYDRTHTFLQDHSELILIYLAFEIYFIAYR